MEIIIEIGIKLVGFVVGGVIWGWVEDVNDKRSSRK